MKPDPVPHRPGRRVPVRYRYESLTPAELEVAVRTCSVAYLAVSPLEWHGEHLAFGCDLLRAQHVLEQVWMRTGGVLLPPLYLGTDTTLKRGGVTLWGMETSARQRLPGSLFLRPATLKAVLRDTLDQLERQGFKLCVLGTGHEARNQRAIVESCEKGRAGRPMKVLAWWATRFPTAQDHYPDEFGHHAGTLESAELMAIDSGLVELRRAGVKRRDRSVSLDRRLLMQATAKMGRERLAAEVDALVEQIVSKGAV